MGDLPGGTFSQDVPLPFEGVASVVRSVEEPERTVAVEGDVEGLTGHDARAFRVDPGLWWAHVHPEDRPDVRERLLALQPGSRGIWDFRIQSSTGATRWVREHATVSTVRGGRAVVSFLRDVSLEHSLRQQIAALEERIWRTQRVDSLGVVATGFAHDLNNLLQAILTTVSLLEDEVAGEARTDVELIRDAAERGARMSRDLLRFALRERTHGVAPLDPCGLVDDLHGILERAVGGRVRLELDLSTDVPGIQADPSRLEQVLLNLVVNARDAMPRGGTVRLGVRAADVDAPLDVEAGVLEPGRYVVFDVSDEGHGIPGAARERIFEPFFTTKERDSSGSGSGFGLSTVLRIVRGYGGGIGLETEVGRGTRFSVYLPVRAASPAVPEVTRPAGAPAAAEAERLRVLVVEDDAAVRQVVARALGGRGHHVVAVATAADALQAFDRVRPVLQVAVCDVYLPDRSGVELVRAMRNRVPRLPVVYLSGYAGESEALRQATQEEVFLAKPFGADELQRALERAVRRQGGRDDDGDVAPPRRVERRPG